MIDTGCGAVGENAWWAFHYPHRRASNHATRRTAPYALAHWISMRHAVSGKVRRAEQAAKPAVTGMLSGVAAEGLRRFLGFNMAKG